MIDHVLVTVETPDGKRDMELPSEMPTGELTKNLMEVFREAGFRYFIGRSEVALSFEGKPLPVNKTLAECFVWDGSILTVR